MQALLFVLGVMAIFYIWLALRVIVFHAKFCRPYHRIPEMFFLRGTGLLFLGGLGYLWGRHCTGLSAAQLGLQFSSKLIAWPYVGLAAIIIPLMALLQVRKNRTLWEYPVIRAKRWSITLIVLSAFSWVVYLVAFEVFFRGVFFFGVLHYLGQEQVLLAAIICAILYCGLYASAHFYEDRRIIPVAAVFAFITNLISYETGSILTAICIHVLNAWIFEWFTLYKHPEMQVRGLV